ncbi:MAG: hypothetical protein AUK53_07430 [Betaproteobacteria bacterium CG2_30_59_46]|nr:MAG: hypothetical protein AUK53_07430 [Betaproteobacteria bacterium CG2_30_59_46]
MMKSFRVLIGAAMFFSGVAVAQVSVDVSGYGVRVQSGAGVDVNSGSIGSDVQMEGVAVINGDVFIDGEKIPKGKSVYTSKKTKKTYLIHWGKDGNVSVSEK